MKTQTKYDMIECGASEAEAEAALQLLETLRPCIKIRRKNGRIETKYGDKTILGFYRTVKDAIAQVPQDELRATIDLLQYYKKD